MKNKIICAVFLLFVFGFTVFDLLTPDREFSEWENRNLAQAPSLTVESLLSGDFGSDYETYMTDQFAGRDIFVKAKFLTDSTIGKTESGGVYVTDDALYSIQPQPDYKVIDKNLTAISSFVERTGIDSYLTVVPSSTYIYSDKLPAYAPVVNEKEIFSYIGNNLKSAKFLDITDKLSKKRTDYIYFRTDHHWTSDGALIGYNAFREALGKKPLENVDCSVVSVDFLGTLSSKSGAMGINSDVMERYDSCSATEIEVWNGNESVTYPSVYFDEYLTKKDKYSYYLGTNQPIVRVKTDSDGGKLLVFKDSYAHIMTPFMTGDWSEIVLVDLRYVKVKIDVLLKDVIGSDITDFDTALFLYSTETFTTQDNMLWIK